MPSPFGRIRAVRPEFSVLAVSKTLCCHIRYRIIHVLSNESAMTAMFSSARVPSWSQRHYHHPGQAVAAADQSEMFAEATPKKKESDYEYNAFLP